MFPGEWDDLVVICAGTSWDGIWYPEKHIADRLSSVAPVLYVDPPVGRVPEGGQPVASRLGQPWLRLVRPNLARLTPVVLPGMHRIRAVELNEILARRCLRRAVSQLTNRVRAVVVAAPAYPFGVCGERLRVLYATDDFVAGARLMGLPVSQLQRTERRQARSVDMVLAASEALVDKWRSLGHDAVFVPNGCDVEMFARTDEAPCPGDVKLPRPIAGFVGHLSDRIDLDMLRTVADRGISLLLVGPRQSTFEMSRVDRLLSRPNVFWAGPRPFETLPSYLGMIDVGLTPYADTDFNRASFPLKTLEYLAAGRGAVASDLPAVRWLDTELVRIAATPESFGDAVEDELRRASPPEVVSRRRDFARRHSWSARTAQFAAALGVQWEERTLGAHSRSGDADSIPMTTVKSREQ